MEEKTTAAIESGNSETSDNQGTEANAETGRAGTTESTTEFGLSANPLRDITKHWLAVITQPHVFFADMPTAGGFIPPLIFVIATGLAAGIIRMVIGLVGWGFYVTAAVAILALILTPIFVAIGSFIGAGILYLIWQGMGSKASFKTSYRCAAYVTAIAPITVLLRLIPYAGGVLALAWVCGLLILASEKVHGIARNKALIVFGIIFAVLAILGLVSEYHARHFIYALGNWRIHINP